MSDNTFMKQIANLITPENLQKYILGSKKNGEARALYDIVRDVSGIKGRKKKRKQNLDYLSVTFGGKKKKKKKKKKKCKF